METTHPARPRNGYPAAYVIKEAKIIAAAGKVHDPGTVVVRQGVIVAVGPSKDIAIPLDAEVIEGKGLVVYPGFIDLFTTVGQRAGVDRSATGQGQLVNLAETPLAATPADNRKGLTPEFDTAATLELTDAVAEPRRRLGFTALLSVPSGSIATGQSALVSTSGLPRRDSIVRRPWRSTSTSRTPRTRPQPCGPTPQPSTDLLGSGPRGRREVENPYPGRSWGPSPTCVKR